MSGAPALERLERATAELEPPFAVVDLDAFWANAADMERRAAPKPIRLASKSVRCRALQNASSRVLASGARSPTHCPRPCGSPSGAPATSSSPTPPPTAARWRHSLG